MGNVSKKGGAFERWCSRQLSLWWTDGDRDDCVWRTSGSGATHTTRGKKGKKTAGQAGDLCAQDETMLPFFNHFLVECKSGYASQTRPANAIGLLYCIDRTRHAKDLPLIIRWFMKAVGESLAADRSDALLIFKRTGRGSCIAMRTSTKLRLSDYAGRYEWDCATITYCLDEEGITPLRLVILPLELFFDWCSSSHMKRYIIDTADKNIIRRR